VIDSPAFERVHEGESGWKRTVNYLVADNGMLTRLRGIMEPVEIRDATGKVLGHYTPLVSPETLELCEKAKALFDWEEAERVARTEHDGYTIEEVLQHLRSLEK